METEIPVTVRRDVQYLPQDRSERLDLHLPTAPAGSGSRGAIVFVHGGSFHSDDKGSTRSQSTCDALAAAGYVVANVNYLLAEGRSGDARWTAWPTNVWDCAAALQYLRRQADDLHVDPERIAVLGMSAGSTLAMLLAFARPDELPGEPSDPDQGAFAVRAAVNLYGRGDWNVHTIPSKLPSSAETRRAASPVNYLSPRSASIPPVLTVHGDADEVVPFAHALHLDAALRAVGGSHTLHKVAGAGHSFGLTPPQGDLRPVVLDFLSEHLR